MQQMKGVTLLEVLLAIVIFVIGMLALAHLQTNLTRSATDANTRTVAASIGEELLESLLAFRRVETDPDGVLFAFADIDDGFVSRTIPRGGINYTVTAEVWGYDFASDGQTVSDPPVAAVAGTVYDFKVVDLVVAWDNNQAFQVDEDTQVANSAMGSGTIEISSLIPSIPSLTSAKVAAEDDDPLGYVPVDYAPGERPDIIAIDLDNGRFKETTTPLPDVIRTDQLVETWFDVITYNQGQSDTLFQRREEFLVVSCQCELREPSGGEETGFLPTVWNGVGYTEGEWVSKNYGASASNQNSAYCDVCCRDHHDSPSHNNDAEQFDPSKTWTAVAASGDHKHYDRGNRGTLVEATQDGDNYVEACRMVRKDGFMRVAQDFRQEGFIAFPAGYLDTQAGTDEYSDYVAQAVEDFYENNRDTLTSPDGTSSPSSPESGISFTFPASSDDNATTLPTGDGLLSQQLRSRGLYIDHLGAEAAAIVNCIAQGGSGDDCGVPGVDNYLQVFPFFEVETTWLSWWTENSHGNPVSVTNENVETDNTHSRGLAQHTGTTAALVKVKTEMHRGNVGLAVIDPIDPLESSGLAKANYEVRVATNGGGPPPPTTGYTWSGMFASGVPGVDAADAAMTITPGVNTTCQRSGTSIACTTTFGSSGSMVVSGYYKNPVTSLWICGSGLDGITVTNGDPAAALKSATLEWPDGTNPTAVVLSIENSVCN
jgi:hypothetical protein